MSLKMGVGKRREKNKERELEIKNIILVVRLIEQFKCLYRRQLEQALDIAH